MNKEREEKKKKNMVLNLLERKKSRIYQEKEALHDKTTLCNICPRGLVHFI